MAITAMTRSSMRVNADLCWRAMAFLLPGSVSRRSCASAPIPSLYIQSCIQSAGALYNLEYSHVKERSAQDQNREGLAVDGGTLMAIRLARLCRSPLPPSAR